MGLIDIDPPHFYASIMSNKKPLPAFVIISAISLCIVMIGIVVSNTNLAQFLGSPQQKDTTFAATCNKNAVIVQASFNTTVNCIADNGVMYLPDNQVPSLFQFFSIQSEYQNAVFIQTPNTEIKDNQSLSWSINLSTPATVYLMTRHIPGITAPQWIRSGYSRQTNDDMSQVIQYFKRKNGQGLIGLYDIYSKQVNASTVTFQGASDSQNPAYSMYMVVIALQNAPTSTATRTPTPTNNIPIPTGPPGEQKGYIATNTELAQRRSQGGPAISYADNALGRNPNPQNPLNIPGTTGPFVDDANAVNVLGIAYGLTGDIKYASKAREYIMAWVNTTKSLTNACPDSGGCQTALITSRMTPSFVFAADHIKPSGVFSSADDAAFKNWLKTVMLPSASTRTNNWGDAGLQMKIVVSDYIGDSSSLAAGIAKFKSQVDLVASDGHIPEETRRGTGGITYSSGAIGFRVVAAKVMERRGMDLWSYGRMKLSVDYLAKYVTNPTAWPWASGAGTAIHSWWELAYAKWRDPVYQPIVIKGRPIGVYENNVLPFSTITNGI